MATLRARFEAKYRVEPTSSCWQWFGATDVSGYGRFSTGGKGVAPGLAHRVAYEMHVGPIPPGLVIDHLCRNRSCVNPAHLEAVTPAENVRRTFEHPRVKPALRTHCPQGHEFTPENTRTPPSGGRKCIACAKETTRRFHERHPTYARDYDRERRRA